MFCKGYVHVYTGNGKGKTTAAIGLAIRAAGAGIRVFIGHFLKGKWTSEHEVLKKLCPMIDVELFGREGFITKNIQPVDRDCVLKGVERVKKVMKSGSYGLVIMDEINVALKHGLVDVDVIIGMVKNRPRNLELVLTGRGAPSSIIDLADLVTEMKEVKHYSKEGVKARKGIEK